MGDDGGYNILSAVYGKDICDSMSIAKFSADMDGATRKSKECMQRFRRLMAGKEAKSVLLQKKQD